jgi:hypothetical protein
MTGIYVEPTDGPCRPRDRLLMLYELQRTNIYLAPKLNPYPRTRLARVKIQAQPAPAIDLAGIAAGNVSRERGDE